MNYPDMVFFLAQASSPLLDELSVGGAILLTIAGIALHLYRPGHRMSVEERVKDSRITEAEARRQIQFLRLWAPMVTVLGTALLCLAIYDLMG
jgi:hypothetical protein